MADRPPRVFISYSHDSDAHSDRVLELATRLRSEGVDTWIDRYELAPPEGSTSWMTADSRRPTVASTLAQD